MVTMSAVCSSVSLWLQYVTILLSVKSHYTKVSWGAPWCIPTFTVSSDHSSALCMCLRLQASAALNARPFFGVVNFALLGFVSRLSYVWVFSRRWMITVASMN